LETIRPVEGTLLAWPASDEEARWIPPEGCWVHCFEPGYKIDKEPNIRLIGEALPLDHEDKMALRLANGTTIYLNTPPKSKASLGEIVSVELDSARLYRDGVFAARQIRRARGKARLEFLRLRSLMERPEPALRVDGDDEFSINYSDVVLVHGKAKAGKTRALLALFADGAPREKGIRVERRMHTVGNPMVYYMSHITETPLPRLRDYAVKLGWSPERAEAYLYPFEHPGDLEEFLEDEAVPENSLVIVDSLIKLFPRGVTGEGENDALQVEKTLTPIIQAARKRKHLLILIHHQTKSSGEPRGSSAIQALPDHLITVKEIGGDGVTRNELRYEKGRTNPPKGVLLRIIEESSALEETNKAEGAKSQRRHYGRPPKYDEFLFKAA